MQFHICGEFSGKKITFISASRFFSSSGIIRKDIVKKRNWLYLSKNLNNNSSNQNRVEKNHRGSSEEKRYSSCWPSVYIFGQTPLSFSFRSDNAQWSVALGSSDGSWNWIFLYLPGKFDHKMKKPQALFKFL